MHKINLLDPLVCSLLATTLMIATACGGVVDNFDAPQSIQDQNLESTLETALPGTALTAVGVSASGSNGNSARQAIDGDMDTRWSCTGVDCWIRLDLGSAQSVKGLAVAWQQQGNRKRNTFVVAVSSDDKTYTQAYAGRNSGRNSRFESYEFGGVNGRYVRLAVQGVSLSSNTGVSEMKSFGTAVAPQATPADESPDPVDPPTPPTNTPAPVSCTGFSYSAWGTCSVGGSQTRTLAASTPAGCTGGTPVLSQRCTPPVSAPLTCTAFTYSAYSACSVGGTQGRAVASSSPSGCTGGSPVLSRSCTPPPVICTSFAYSAWGTCSSGGSQTRSVASSSPASCTGGSPALSQSCTPPAAPPAPPSPPAPPTSNDDYDSVVLSDGPVGFWGMSGSTTEPDLSGNGRVGTYKGGTLAAATLPNGEDAKAFNGTSHYLTIPSHSAFSIPTTGSLTFEAWIRPDVLQFPMDSSDGYVDWMGKCQDYSPSCEWEARMYGSSTAEGRPNRMSAYVFNTGAGLGSAADWQPANGLVQAGKWYHVVGMYSTRSFYSDCSSGSSPGSITIFVNGVEWSHSSHGDTGCMSQYSVRPGTSSSPVNIGTMSFDTFFKGAIGKVAIYNRLLSAAEVASHYKAMTTRAPGGSCSGTCALTIQ